LFLTQGGGRQGSRTLGLAMSRFRRYLYTSQIAVPLLQFTRGPFLMRGAKGNLITLIAIDDDPATLELISEALGENDLEVHTATDPEEGLGIVREKRPEIVLLDLMMPKLDGMALLEKILMIDPGIEVILITGHYSTESAVQAIQKGAGDYLNKPLSIALLREKVGKLAEAARSRRRAMVLDKELLKEAQFEGMIGRSPVMLEVFERIRRVAPHFRTTLLIGATGSGKELAARALHRLSPVSSGRFVACNCSAIAESLFESELFGHVKGAFTGAFQDKVGFLEYASGGVLFLDEIGDMPIVCQNKLLRVLETREFQRVGSPTIHKADVRIVAATNRDLHDLMARQLFREDLYYRLSMVEIKLPELAKRKEDLPYLEHHFLEKFALQYSKTIRGITPKAKILLASYSWPGNVRELENVLGHACMLTQDDRIDVKDLPEHLRNPMPMDAAAQVDAVPLAELSRAHVFRILEQTGGNKTLAAKMLGINRATLYRILKRAEIHED
jgi:DNA-binding NtrC family response regulator